MLTETTVSKLREMRLSVMANALKDQLADPQFQNMTFEDRLGLLVDAEWNARKNNHLNKLIRQATFSDPGACLENVEYLPDRGLKQEELLRFGTCNYIQEHHNIILLGATGSGKTYLACALGMAAARRFYAVKYIRLPDLLVEFQIARGNGTIRKFMAQYRKYALLMIGWISDYTFSFLHLLPAARAKSRERHRRRSRLAAAAKLLVDRSCFAAPFGESFSGPAGIAPVAPAGTVPGKASSCAVRQEWRTEAPTPAGAEVDRDTVLRRSAALHVSSRTIITAARRNHMKGILAGDDFQGTAIIPMAVDRTDVIDKFYGSFRSGRNGLRIVHGIQNNSRESLNKWLRIPSF